VSILLLCFSLPVAPLPRLTLPKLTLPRLTLSVLEISLWKIYPASAQLEKLNTTAVAHTRPCASSGGGRGSATATAAAAAAARLGCKESRTGRELAGTPRAVSALARRSPRVASHVAAARAPD
jgi:hypothetical protein